MAKKLLPKQYTHLRFPITNKIDFHPYFDKTFQPSRDLRGNFGNIEYIEAKHKHLPYYNYYAKPDSLNWKTAIVYNDQLEDLTNESIALDAVTHGLRELDRKYQQLLNKAENIYKTLDVGLNIDNEELYSIIDGHVRSILVPDSLANKMNYDKHEIDEYPDDYKLAIGNLVKYITHK